MKSITMVPKANVKKDKKVRNTITMQIKLEIMIKPETGVEG
jgi:hypothetical protein